MFKYKIGDKVRLKNYDNELTITSMTVSINHRYPEYGLEDESNYEGFTAIEPELLIVVEDDELLSSVSLLNALQSQSTDCEGKFTSCSVARTNNIELGDYFDISVKYSYLGKEDIIHGRIITAQIDEKWDSLIDNIISDAKEFEEKADKNA